MLSRFFQSLHAYDSMSEDLLIERLSESFSPTRINISLDDGISNLALERSSHTVTQPRVPFKSVAHYRNTTKQIKYDPLTFSSKQRIPAA